MLVAFCPVAFCPGLYPATPPTSQPRCRTKDCAYAVQRAGKYLDPCHCLA